MMTSQADVMQTGVVIGQAAEKGYVYLSMCVCVVCTCISGQGESMQCPLGFSAVIQSFGWTLTITFVLEEEKIEEER